MLFHCLFPKLGKVMAVLTGAVIHLHDPNIIRIPQQMLVILGIEGKRSRRDLVDIPAVLIIMLPFLRIAEDLPRLHDLLKLLLAGMTVGVLIRMVLQHQLFVLRFQLGLSHSAGGLQDLVVVDFGV